jgi:tryptophan halogenase
VQLTGSESLNPYTTATAHKAGWIWDIPLTTRRGTGFVYASKYMSDEEALELYAQYLGVEVSEISPRKIPMQVGYREKFWHKNCVALGLAQGFLEPIEATSILLSDFSAELLARNFPKHMSDIEKLAPYYNKVITYTWDRTVDFIKLHYCISDRTDSPFWQDNSNEQTLSDELKERLSRFEISPPNQSDFFSKFDMFDEKNFLYVLYGMNFHTNKNTISPQELKHCKQLFESNDALVSEAANQLLNHKDWLVGLKAAMQNIRR